jgi:DNA-binding NarL/FixJ family response regulator
LLHAVRQVYAGRNHIPQQLAAQLIEHMGDQSLSARELEVLTRVAQGNRNREIGELLFISEATVKVHMKHIMDKLGAKDRTDRMILFGPQCLHHVDAGCPRRGDNRRNHGGEQQYQSRTGHR